MPEQIATTPEIGLTLELYRGMLEMREFESKVQELYRGGKLPGFVHLLDDQVWIHDQRVRKRPCLARLNLDEAQFGQLADFLGPRSLCALANGCANSFPT